MAPKRRGPLTPRQRAAKSKQYKNQMKQKQKQQAVTNRKNNRANKLRNARKAHRATKQKVEDRSYDNYADNTLLAKAVGRKNADRIARGADKFQDLNEINKKVRPYLQAAGAVGASRGAANAAVYNNQQNGPLPPAAEKYLESLLGGAGGLFG